MCAINQLDFDHGLPKLCACAEAGSSTGRTARDPVLAFSVIGSAIVLILGLVKGFAYPNLSILDWDQFVGSGGMLLYGGNKAVADCRGKAAESLISAEKAAEIAAKAQALADVLKGLVNSAGVNQLALLEEFGKLEHAMAVERPQHAAVKLQYQNLLLQFNEQKQQNEALVRDVQTCNVCMKLLYMIHCLMFQVLTVAAVRRFGGS